MITGRELNGVPLYINGLLPPGTLERHLKGTPQEFFVADSMKTAQIYIDCARRVRQYEDRIPCGNCGHVHLGSCSICNACEQIEPPRDLKR